jgi:signal peptidase I
MNIKGTSMHPFIKKSDIVTVKPIKFEETRVGDIIAYTRSIEHGFTVHRLIKKRRDCQGKEYLTSKGDANRYGDAPVYPDDVHGKVITIERNGKSINLETRFRYSLGYLIAYLSYGLALGREMVFQPHLFSIKIWRKVKR